MAELLQKKNIRIIVSSRQTPSDSLLKLGFEVFQLMPLNVQSISAKYKKLHSIIQIPFYFDIFQKIENKDEIEENADESQLLCQFWSEEIKRQRIKIDKRAWVSLCVLLPEIASRISRSGRVSMDINELNSIEKELKQSDSALRSLAVAFATKENEPIDESVFSMDLCQYLVTNGYIQFIGLGKYRLSHELMCAFLAAKFEFDKFQLIDNCLSTIIPSFNLSADSLFYLRKFLDTDNKDSEGDPLLSKFDESMYSNTYVFYNTCYRLNLADPVYLLSKKFHPYKVIV